MPDQDRRESEAGDAVVPETEEAAEPQIPEVEPEAEAVAEAPKSYEELHRPFHVVIEDLLDQGWARMNEQPDEETAETISNFLGAVSRMARRVIIPEVDRERVMAKYLALSSRISEIMDMPALCPDHADLLIDQLDKDTLKRLLDERGWEVSTCDCGCNHTFITRIGLGGYEGLRRLMEESASSPDGGLLGALLGGGMEMGPSGPLPAGLQQALAQSLRGGGGPMIIEIIGGPMPMGAREDERPRRGGFLGLLGL